jgi:hypothetical protein
MRRVTRFTSVWISLGIIAVLACGLSAFPTLANAQGTQGQDAVYNSSGGIVGSSSFIDASMFVSNQNPNICAVLNSILSSKSYPATGAVIDARGLNSNNTSMTCQASPWAGISNPLPSTILLPAGTIQIPGTWILPSNTRLIGEGENNPLSAAPGTTIQATNVFSGSMIQFGSSSFCGTSPTFCSGISVERLTLDGQAQAVNGIVNQYSQTNTRVDHVTIYQIRGTGLLISDTGASSASNSGPYTNIIFDTGGYPGLSTTACAQIWNANGLLTGTRGIHGLRCKSETQDANAAVMLDASNNSIEDVTVVGFYDGVLVGSNAIAHSNVLLNIIGDTQSAGVTPVNAIHISKNFAVTDLSIMGVSNSGLTGTYTIQDDVTSPHLSDPSVGIYALGEPATSNGYTRFSTSPNVAS